MKRNIVTIILYLLQQFCFLNIADMSICHAQGNTPDWQKYYEMIADENDEDSEEMELIYEALSEAASHPINLNAVTREQLQELICFTDDQIDDILDYVDRFAPVRTKAELMMLTHLDPARRGILASVTYLGEKEKKFATELDSLKYAEATRYNRMLFDKQQGKGELTTFARIPFYSRKGDGDKYQGGRIRHWLRTSYAVNRHLKVGFMAAQDAGEPFFCGSNKQGYDFYSGYLQLKKLGVLKTLVVGRYRIKSGLGLILNNNYSYGKLFSLSSLQSTATSIRPHSSRSEGNYLQGTAATLALSKVIEATAFVSYRKIDATLTADSCGIATILKSGYHRTESEISRKHNASQTSAGAVVRLNLSRWHLEASAIMNHYNLPLIPYKKSKTASTEYKRFYASGRNFWNASISYGYKLGRRWHFEGETATGDSKEVATVNTLSWSPDRRLSLMAVQRFYPYRFYATMGKSFAEGGTNQNESGIYIGGTWNVNSRLTLTAYSDFAYFPWPKYQAYGTSVSSDNMVQLTFLTSSHSSLTARYRCHMRQKDGEKKGQLIYKDDHYLRLAYTVTHGAFTWKTQLDGALCQYKETDIGGMISTNVKYNAKEKAFAAGVAYFNSESYNTRLYAYEHSTPYNLSYPSFYGNGMRAYAIAQITLAKGLSVIAKGGFTHYFDRQTIGSSYQEIASSSQTDLDIMLKWNF